MQVVAHGEKQVVRVMRKWTSGHKSWMQLSLHARDGRIFIGILPCPRRGDFVEDILVHCPVSTGSGASKAGGKKAAHSSYTEDMC